MTINLYVLSRKIHRILVIIITIAGFLMAFTGILLKYPYIAGKLNFLNLGQIRYLHNNLSPIFTILFFLMGITGIIMYLFPLIRNK
jgi:Na+/alanine symporter